MYNGAVVLRGVIEKLKVLLNAAIALHCSKQPLHPICGLRLSNWIKETAYLLTYLNLSTISVIRLTTKFAGVPSIGEKFIPPKNKIPAVS